ncbi:hypothetical protein BCR44DRAFT_31999 [Catenaria anguillulae PL171]|uniref:Uncharacterized protein n=1 Tax=Catenaria anguillulae PL171 TaxID=765915 RepID=A0A1Y2HRZ2_9FUNG|nr:hypothetical protein BCR44DRAFT_31999 [Catenaria anguillulae PL171]
MHLLLLLCRRLPSLHVVTVVMLFPPMLPFSFVRCVETRPATATRWPRDLGPHTPHSPLELSPNTLQPLAFLADFIFLSLGLGQLELRNLLCMFGHLPGISFRLQLTHQRIDLPRQLRI